MPKRSKVHPSHKTRYRVTNWNCYDRALVERGSLTVWLFAEAIRAWTPENTGQCSGQPRYSDVAVRTALYIRLLTNSAIKAGVQSQQQRPTIRRL